MPHWNKIHRRRELRQREILERDFRNPGGLEFVWFQANWRRFIAGQTLDAWGQNSAFW
jgi:hypothetical protein